MNNIDKIKTAIDRANKHESKLTDEILNGIDGMSSHKFRHLLNNLVDEATRYLEIGVWQGSTFISALYNNTPEFSIAIDDSSHHGNVAELFYNNYRRFFKKEPNYLPEDSFTVSLEKHNIKDINLYFYDGGHDWDDHYKAITYYYPALADNFILIVDDYNDAEKIQHATQCGIRDKGIIVEYSEFLTSPTRSEWWNGTYIASCKKL